MFVQLVVLALAAVAFAEPQVDPFVYYTNTYNYKPVVPVVSKYAVPAAYYNPALYYNPYNPVVYTAPAAPIVAKAAEPVADVEKVEEKTEVVAPTPSVDNYSINKDSEAIRTAPSLFGRNTPEDNIRAVTPMTYGHGK